MMQQVSLSEEHPDMITGGLQLFQLPLPRPHLFRQRPHLQVVSAF